MKLADITNTITNLAFGVSGIIGFYHGGPYREEYLIASVLLMLGSAAFHWLYESERLGTLVRALDEVGMYLVLSVLMVHASDLSPDTGHWVLAGLWMISLFSWKWLNSHIVIPYGVAFMMGALFHGHAFAAMISALFMGLALMFWILDRPRYHGLLHGYWHVFVAVAQTITYIYA